MNLPGLAGAIGERKERDWATCVSGRPIQFMSTKTRVWTVALYAAFFFTVAGLVFASGLRTDRLLKERFGEVVAHD